MLNDDRMTHDEPSANPERGLVTVDHPMLAGHFPGHPIVPGVVLLDAVLDAIRSSRAHAIELESIVSTKFLQAVAPERRVDLTIKFAAEDGGRWKARFVATHEGAAVLEGSFLLASTSDSGAAP